MPRHSSNILELARRGADQRYAELKAEIASLVRDFPHLGGRGRSARAAGDGETTTTRRRGRRRKMSAAARKAVSERMRKYWAARRSAKSAKSK